jgi:hypothetical protein
MDIEEASEFYRLSLDGSGSPYCLSKVAMKRKTYSQPDGKYIFSFSRTSSIPMNLKKSGIGRVRSLGTGVH